MDVITLISEIITAIFKHGLSLTTFAVSVTALLRVNGVRKAILRRLPKRFRQADKLDRIEQKLDALLKKEGVVWDADLKNGASGHVVTTGAHKKLSSPQEAYAPATTTKHFTLSKGISHFPQRRMKMKSKLLSRKFILAVVSAILVVLNDGLNLGIDKDTVMAFVGIIATYIVGESAVDVAKKPTGGTTNDTSDLNVPIESSK